MAANRCGYAFALLGAAWCVWVREDQTLDFLDRELRHIAAGDAQIERWAHVMTAKNELLVVGPIRTHQRAAELIDKAVGVGDLPTAWLAGWLDEHCRMLTRNPSAGRKRLRQVERVLPEARRRRPGELDRGRGRPRRHGP